MTAGLNKTIRDELIQYGQHPQGLKALGIKGRRDSDMRYRLYNLDRYLKKDMNVLDIGCNCGFFSCLVAQHANTVTGIDINEQLLHIAWMSAIELNLRNVRFLKEDFNQWRPHLRDDFVIACQIHHWVKIPFNKYAARLASIVRPGGFLLFESHDTDNVDHDIDDKVRMLHDKGFATLHTGGWTEDPGRFWIPPKKHKPIPRQFFVMKYEGT